MSAQFGKFNFDGRPVDSSDLSRVRSLLVPYGPDREGSLCKGNFGILYRAFNTSEEARRESQPFVNSSGITVTWDGRLDNRDELLTQVKGVLPQEATDGGDYYGSAGWLLKSQRRKGPTLRLAT